MNVKEQWEFELTVAEAQKIIADHLARQHPLARVTPDDVTFDITPAEYGVRYGDPPRLNGVSVRIVREGPPNPMPIMRAIDADARFK
jgi:hypothetical protein